MQSLLDLVDLHLGQRAVAVPITAAWCQIVDETPAEALFWQLLDAEA